MPEIQSQKSLISILADNKKGMLSKLTTFFAENNMNIESLTLSPADIENKIHRTTAYITGDRNRIGGLCEEMKKIEGVHNVVNFMASSFIERELGLIKVNITDPKVPAIISLVNEFGGKTIYVDSKIMICQIEAVEEGVDKFMSKVKEIANDVEILRSGIVATSLDESIYK